MIFSEKEYLAKKYYEWLEKVRKEKEVKVVDNALAVINFLDELNCLKNNRI